MKVETRPVDAAAAPLPPEVVKVASGKNPSTGSSLRAAVLDDSQPTSPVKLTTQNKADAAFVVSRPPTLVGPPVSKQPHTPGLNDQSARINPPAASPGLPTEVGVVASSPSSDSVYHRNGRQLSETSDNVPQTRYMTSDESQALTTLAQNFDLFKGDDWAVTKEDLQRVANLPERVAVRPATPESSPLKTAANYLLDHSELWTDRLDMAAVGGPADGKVGIEDVQAQMQYMPLSSDDAKALTILANHYDLLYSPSQSMSVDQLKDISSGIAPPLAAIDDDMKWAAKYLVEQNPTLLNFRLDVAANPAGKQDGVIGRQDVQAMMRFVPLSGDDVDALQSVAKNWYFLTSEKDHFTSDDLKSIVNGDRPLASQQLKEAAQHLLDNPSLLTYRLDVASERGDPDGRVDKKDLAAQLRYIPLSTQDQTVLGVMETRWDTLTQGTDKQVTYQLLNEIVSDNFRPAWADDEIQNMAQYLLNRPDLLYRLDIASSGGAPDDQISKGDLSAVFDETALGSALGEAASTPHHHGISGALQDFYQGAGKFVEKLADEVVRGVISEEDMVSKVMEETMLAATGVGTDIKALGQLVIDKTDGIVKQATEFGKQVMDQSFDKLWDLQNPGAAPEDPLGTDPNRRQLTQLKGDMGANLIFQSRIQGKTPPFIEGLAGIEGDLKLGLPVTGVGTTGKGTGYVGKDKVVKLSLTGELDLSAAAGGPGTSIGASGGLEFNVGLSVTKNGVRVDSIGGGVILDANAMVIGGKLVDRVKQLIGQGPRGPSDLQAQWANAGSYLPNGWDDVAKKSLELATTSKGVFKGPATEASNFVMNALSDAMERGGAEAPPVPTTPESWSKKAEIFSTLEGALNLNWVNSDLATAGAPFRAGWNHDGASPDQLILAMKNMTGVRHKYGEANLNVQQREYLSSAAGVGLTFSEAGAKMFGRAVEEF